MLPHNRDHHHQESKKSRILPKKEDKLKVTVKEAIQKIETEENQISSSEKHEEAQRRSSPHPRPGGCLEVNGIDAYLQGLWPEARRKPVSPAYPKHLEF